MKAALVITTLFLLFALAQLPCEPDLTNDYALTKFERCEQAYRGSDDIIKCKGYK